MCVLLYSSCVAWFVELTREWVEFMYLVFTRMPGESYCRRLRSLWLCLCVTSFERWLTPLFVDSGFTYEKSFEVDTDDRVRPVLTLCG